MDDSERQWIQREFDDIKSLFRGLKCTEHGEAIASLRQALSNGKEHEKEMRTERKDWKTYAISAMGLVIAALMAFMAYSTYLKK